MIEIKIQPIQIVLVRELRAGELLYLISKRGLEFLASRCSKSRSSNIHELEKLRKVKANPLSTKGSSMFSQQKVQRSEANRNPTLKSQ
ncbi:hypothetical protein M7I_4232 [Glarea lozoyensis 74030]|uniref:Uncharacterized protein n=1 Tax=Glarea lozoyensis (strain ATCC 74030 / MF5533) TaxID=1104152 RepID=H0ENM3_GLAL7|nr:hypothetical protein M7I_4232 [Glarea lozoyensis 74030]